MSILHVPQPDCVVKAGAGKSVSIRGEGQPGYPVAMSCDRLHAGCRFYRLHLPQTYLSPKVSAGEQMPIGTPGDGIDWMGMWQCLLHRSTVSIPDLNSSVALP